MGCAEQRPLKYRREKTTFSDRTLRPDGTVSTVQSHDVRAVVLDICGRKTSDLGLAKTTKYTEGENQLLDEILFIGSAKERVHLRTRENGRLLLD